MSSPAVFDASDCGPLERLVQVLGRLDQPDPAPAPARGRLDHQRVADLLRVLARGLDVRHRAAAPRRERHADLLGQPLRRDLVAELAHHLGGRADEHDVQAAAQLGELGLLGDEPPARPRGVGPGQAQRPLQLVVVEVGVVAETLRVVRADEHRLVGLADEHRLAVDGGVERDRPQRLRRGPSESPCEPTSAFHSRTALMSRIAGSPRLTIAILENSGTSTHSPNATRTSSLVVLPAAGRRPGTGAPASAVASGATMAGSTRSTA